MAIHELSWQDLLNESETPLSREAWSEIRRRLELVASNVLQTPAPFAPEDRQDLVQETLLKLQDPAFLQRARASRNPGAYLYVVLSNAGRDLLRRRRREREALTELGSWPPPLLETGDAGQELRRRLRHEIARLPPEPARLLEMRFEEGRTIQEIADELGIGYSAAAVRIHRLSRKLAERVQKSGGR
jgi:RNA polymerase sigma factor (sigma-70 family)